MAASSSRQEGKLYDLHRGMMSHYLGRGTTDIEILRKHFRFIMDDDEEEEGAPPPGWEKRMAKRYYDK